MGADSNATIVDAIRAPAIIDGNESKDSGPIVEGALIIALAISEETFAEHPKESGIFTLAAVHFCCCICIASDMK